MGGYDLYGNYYARTIDAENAEAAQCASIDADRLAREQSELRDQQQSDAYYTEMRTRQLEQRVIELEDLIAYILGVERR
jgi:hypothetical protein